MTRELRLNKYVEDPVLVLQMLDMKVISLEEARALLLIED